MLYVIVREGRGHGVHDSGKSVCLYSPAKKTASFTWAVLGRPENSDDSAAVLGDAHTEKWPFPGFKMKQTFLEMCLMIIYWKSELEQLQTENC